MLTCIIVSSDNKKQYNNLESVILPAWSGEMQILPGHAESFFLLKAGDIVLRLADNKKETIRITNGEGCVKNDNISVIL